MSLKDLLQDEEFSNLLNSENSEQMADFLNELRQRDATTGDADSVDYIQLNKLFKDLGVFGDIAICDADVNKVYNYVLSGAFWFAPIDSTIDLSTATIYPWGVAPIQRCNIVVGDKTIINNNAIRIYSNQDVGPDTLTFLGIPQCNSHQVGSIDISRDSVFEVLVKKGLKDKVKDLINERFFTRGCIIIKEV